MNSYNYVWSMGHIIHQTGFDCDPKAPLTFRLSLNFTCIHMTLLGLINVSRLFINVQLSFCGLCMSVLYAYYEPG
jgi:hypothetical protein